MDINEFRALALSHHPHPKFIHFEVDDYRDEFVAVTAKPETILTYSFAKRLYTYAFNGGKGVGKSIKEAKTAFEEDYRLIQRNY